MPGRFHRLQLVVEGSKRQITPYFDGIQVCPPVKLNADITPVRMCLGIAHSNQDEAGEVEYQRYAIYPLPQQ